MGSASESLCPVCKKKKIEKRNKLFTFFIPVCNCEDKIIDEYFKNQDIEQRKSRYASANIPERFMYDEFKDWIKKEKVESIRAMLKLFKDGIKENIKSGKGIFIAGNTGIGKTRLLSWLCTRIIFDTDFSLYFITENEIFVRIIKKKEIKWLSALKNIDVLVIDDFSEINMTDQEKEILSDIICYRYNNKKSILITTMQSEERIKAIIGEYLLGRLIEMSKGFIVEVQSENMRYL